MCLGIPMQVLRAGPHTAICHGRNGRQQIDTLVTGPLQPGQWVLCFLGAAREVIDAGRAAQVNDALDALESVLSGSGDVEALIGSHFADLVGREPLLPEFLRPATEKETKQ